MTRTRPAGALSRALLVAVAAGVLAAVAACGSVAAGPASQPAAGASTAAAGTGSPSAAVPLCADASHLDRLVVVVLSSGLLRTPFREALPAGITITDPAKVRAMAAALCALPVLVPNHMQCPQIRGYGYRLTFAAAGRTFRPVLVQLSCHRSVSGLGPVRMLTVALWDQLRKELGTGPRIPATAAS